MTAIVIFPETDPATLTLTAHRQLRWTNGLPKIIEVPPFDGIRVAFLCGARLGKTMLLAELQGCGITLPENPPAAQVSPTHPGTWHPIRRLTAAQFLREAIRSMPFLKPLSAELRRMRKSTALASTAAQALADRLERLGYAPDGGTNGTPSGQAPRLEARPGEPFRNPTAPSALPLPAASLRQSHSMGFPCPMPTQPAI